MNIRQANTKDIGAIMAIYNSARQFMQDTGNGSQWTGGYPSEELIMNDIHKSSLYVCTTLNRIMGVFYFKVEEEKSYATIQNGQWLNYKPYGVIHRLASNGKQKGVAVFCLQWCYKQHNNIRVDTHRNNTVMQTILKKNGYLYCGIITIEDGTERLAFQKTEITGFK